MHTQPTNTQTRNTHASQEHGRATWLATAEATVQLKAAEEEAAGRLKAAEDAQLQTQAVMHGFRAEALEAREAHGQLTSDLAAARAEARAAAAARAEAEAAEARARGDAVVGAVEEYVAALEVAEERSRTRGASQEGR